MKNNYIINDNFLSQPNFVKLRDYITAPTFPWFFNTKVDSHFEDPTPGQFVHTIQHGGVVCSQAYDTLIPIVEHPLCVFVFYRIKLNLQTRLPEPFTYSFHSDTEDMEDEFKPQWTTSILYINTNNGYTEFEDGTKIESIANRLVSFPSSVKHRGISQTDEQTRIVINFNYLKRKNLPSADGGLRL